MQQSVATACCVKDVLFQAEAKQQMCCFVQAYKCSRMCSAVPEVCLHVLQIKLADNLNHHCPYKLQPDCTACIMITFCITNHSTSGSC